MTNYTKPVTRKICNSAKGDLVVTITATGIEIKAPRKHQGVDISYSEIIEYCLAKHPILRWPVDLHNLPYAQLRHLARRQV